MIKGTIKEGSANCTHKWVKRDKKTFQILHRACTECGREELHSENDFDERDAKKLMKVE